MLNKKTFQDLSYPLLLDTLLRRCFRQAWTASGRPSFVVGFPSWTANEIWIELHIAWMQLPAMMPSCVCSFHFKTGHHKKTINILGYYWNEILSLKCRQLSIWFKGISKSSKVSKQTSSVWFHLKEPNKKHDSKHLCDSNKREGMRMRMNDVLTVGLSCQLWPTSSNFLTIVTINAWSIQICHCFCSQWQVSKNQIWTLPFSANEKNTKSILIWYKVTSMRQIRRKNSRSVRMPIMSKWPILHLLLLLVQQTLQPQRHTVGTKPWDTVSPTNQRTTFWPCKSLVSRHASSQESYQFCIVRSIVYHLCIQPSCDNLPLLTVGIRGYRRIANKKDFHWNLKKSCSKSRDFF